MRVASRQGIAGVNVARKLRIHRNGIEVGIVTERAIVVSLGNGQVHKIILRNRSCIGINNSRIGT